MSGHASVLGYALPTDAAGWASLALGVLCLAAAPLAGHRIARVQNRVWIGACAVLAASLSTFWIVYYLRGGPRIVDATSYWLEARALAKGLLSWPVLSPTASFRGRFLLLNSEESATLGVIFPPGYPAVLALGFVLGVPLAVGPALAAALVIATAALAKQASGDDTTMKLAALVSALSGCLRYHTADTMSHGLSALCFATALWFALRAIASQERRNRLLNWLGCGLSAGGLCATRPVTFLALALVGFCSLAFLLGRSKERKQTCWFSPLAWILGAAMPLLLLALHQRAVTGRWLSSAQTAYYLVADGPPGCFRYGFGKGIGCLAEHEPYVRSVLPQGHGIASALITTGRRLHLHLSDIANTELAAALVVLGAWWQRRRAAFQLLASVPIALLLVYVPFYFDGSYPGGGARLISEALVAEHVLLAAAGAVWARRAVRPAVEFPAAASWLSAMMLIGFALRASHQQGLLRDRDGGRPLYDPSLVAQQAGPNGLLFVDNDHAFNLASDPSIRTAAQGRVVARARGDDRDRLVWEALGRPPTWRFHLDPWQVPPLPPVVEVWQPPTHSGTWRFEAEAEWPVVAQQGGYAIPTWLNPNSCVSGGVALGITRTGEEPACATIELPWPGAQTWGVQLRLVVDSAAAVQAWVQSEGERQSWTLPEKIDPATWPGAQRSPEGRWCIDLAEKQVKARGVAGKVTVCSRERWLAIDALRLNGTTPQYH